MVELDTIIIWLILIQAVLTAMGYYWLARDVSNIRTRLQEAMAIGAIMPVMVEGVRIASQFPHIELPTIEAFFLYYLISVIINAITGIPLKVYKKTAL